MTTHRELSTSTTYGIKVSSWSSGTLKIAIPVENHPQKPKIVWLIITPSVSGEGGEEQMGDAQEDV
eukprot:scaffold239_cov66-Phaeocystis_antarctica.AAC.2